MRERQGTVAPRCPQPRGTESIFSLRAPLSVPPAVASPSCSCLGLFCLIPIRVSSPLSTRPAMTGAGGQDTSVLSLALYMTIGWSWGRNCCSLGLSFSLFTMSLS